MSVTRRRLLLTGGALAGVAAMGAWAAPLRARAADRAPQPETAKQLALRNLHTGERQDLVFFRGDAYVPDALAAIQVLLRDYRTGEQHAIDPRLMDYLYDVANAIGVDPVFSVISGYRSPRTNQQLREHSTGVAQHSLHMEGCAIDVRLTGVDCAALATSARAMSRGGVGYYRRSDFVHLDTGAYRTWNG